MFGHLNVWSRGEQLVLFSESRDVFRDEVEGNIRTRGKTKLQNIDGTLIPTEDMTKIN